MSYFTLLPIYLVLSFLAFCIRLLLYSQTGLGQGTDDYIARFDRKDYFSILCRNP